MDSLKAALLTNTFSVEAAKRRVGLVQRILETLFYTEVTGDMSLEARYQLALASEATTEDQAALTDWGTAWLEAFSLETMHAHVADLQAWLSSLPRLTVYVPALLDAEGEAVMGQWCRQELSPNHLIDFEIDAMTMGGCAFIVGGKLYDYSFSTRLRKVPDVIREVLDSYGTK
jgi:hypothetical protein